MKKSTDLERLRLLRQAIPRHPASKGVDAASETHYYSIAKVEFLRAAAHFAAESPSRITRQKVLDMLEGI